ncbi:MAG: 3',5'-cyclic-nucleotide phosphodiesterase [Betaproteobacteria bacterium HGW-Betaproteobacteria-11]|nr:MAG: 3',5'-cyclic-nucleotide phosphodiesterase [Betaproteobacteria bacterium HGW-Betaproteobacteria-11]
MKIRVLGCSGGIGGRHLRTTSFLVDHDILLDAGTGVGDLSLAELAQIDHVFLTHSHLDHVTSLPFLVDTVGDMRNRPLTVHASEATLEILRAHVLNWSIWPDFSQIPSVKSPFLCFSTVHAGEPVSLGDRQIISLPANHTVPAVGYQLKSARGSLVFTGDTGPCPELWKAVNRIDDLRYLLVECAFSNREKRLAKASLHLCPDMLAEELAQLQRDAEIFITHLKPGQIELTMQEIEDCIGEYDPGMLQNNHVFEL